MYLIICLDDNDDKRRDTVYNTNILLDQANQYVYNLFSCNCEVLTCFCRTGQCERAHVERITESLAKETHERLQSSLSTINSGIKYQDYTHLTNKNIHYISYFEL